jgi:hypothetical protein
LTSKNRACVQLKQNQKKKINQNTKEGKKKIKTKNRACAWTVFVND